MKTLLAAILVCVSFSALSQDTTVFGGAGTSCAEWTTKPAVRNTARHWVMGYLSGFNMNVMNDVDMLRGYKAEGAVGWIDKYCSENPLESVFTATFKLSHLLADRVGASRPK